LHGRYESIRKCRNNSQCSAGLFKREQAVMLFTTTRAYERATVTYAFPAQMKPKFDSLEVVNCRMCNAAANTATKKLPRQVKPGNAKQMKHT
jgi:hypothetical protein